MREITFLEDEYGNIEILPVQNYNFCLNQIKEISAFSKKHRASDGAGWTSVYMRKENPETVREMNIDIAFFKTICLSVTNEFDRVYWYDFGFSPQLCKNTMAFGPSKKAVLFSDFNESNIIENLWLSLYKTGESDSCEILELFKKLSYNYKLLIVDWNRGYVEKLIKINKIKKEYLCIL